MPNRLASESSPYLQQHAENPVDWYPWGPEAFAQARERNVPLLLSVGYSACHWCHVMAHESFEDPTIAAQMNAHFVNVKVDREERPDVDAVYMAAVQAMTGHGGWPMTVFLTPDGRPFYGGTYYPPTDRQGMPSFPRVLASVADAFAGREPELAETAASLTRHLAEVGRMPPTPAAIIRETAENALVALAKAYDTQHGGFGGAPKFPPSAVLGFLLKWHTLTGDEDALAMAEHTLGKMARGGMYDQLGGGFHRYSTDATWLVPHFEKMLYDNAQLAGVYARASFITGNPLYKVVAAETLTYLAREMRDAQGGFYSAEDADSEGVEGRFYVWSYDEVLALMGPDDGPLFAACFDLSPGGNFEGHNIPNLPRSLDEIALAYGVTIERLAEVVGLGRPLLFAHRAGRVRPGRDEKVIASWNGMAIRAFAEGGRLLQRRDFIGIAAAGARFALVHMRRADGRLYRIWRDDQAKLVAFLEDHANLADGLLALYAADGDEDWRDEAIALARVIVEDYWEPTERIMYDTGRLAEPLIIRPRELFDNATPSGNAVAADVLRRLADAAGEPEWLAIADAMLASAGDLLQRYPLGLGRMLEVLADRTVAT